MRQWSPFISMAVRHCRMLSDFGASSNSILGTSSLPREFYKTLEEDLKKEEKIRKGGIGETLQNCINAAELSHMESPEADERFIKKLDAQVDDFFAKMPLPEDPMKAALARSSEELEDAAAAELVKEAVREAYMRRLGAEKAEELRLKRASKRREGRSADDCFGETEQFSDVQTTWSSPKVTPSSASLDEDEIRRQLAEMKARMSQLESLLENKKQDK